MAFWKTVVVQVGADHRRGQVLSEAHHVGYAVGHHHAPARKDHWKARTGQELGSSGQALGAAWTALDPQRAWNRDLRLAVEQVARDVELRGAALEHGIVEAAREQLGDPRTLRA